jgi:hypothetical protein
LTDLHGIFSKKKNFEFFFSKWLTQKKLRFSKPPIFEKFSRKFQGLVFGLVGWIDAKGINVAQPV